MRKEIYLKQNGEVDRVETFINNHPYIGMMFIVVLFILCSLIEGLI
jgi:hypothetical protein